MGLIDHQQTEFLKRISELGISYNTVETQC
jgi:hypothetical protein